MLWLFLENITYFPAQRRYRFVGSANLGFASSYHFSLKVLLLQATWGAVQAFVRLLSFSPVLYQMVS